MIKCLGLHNVHNLIIRFFFYQTMNRIGKFPILIYVWFVLSITAVGWAWHDGDNGLVSWDSNCDFPGQDVFKTNSRGEDCGRLCIYNSQCFFFTWSNGNCYLKNHQHNADQTTWAPGAVCGFVKAREKLHNFPLFSQSGFIPR